MKNDSPIILYIDEGDTAYDFFLFSLMVYNILLYDKGYNPNAPIPTVPSPDDTVFVALQNLFVNTTEESEQVALTLTELLILLSIVDNISKALLETNGDRLIAYLFAKFPSLTDDWVTGYLQNAGHIFSSFRQQFADLPQIEALLHRITSINIWNEQ